MKHRISYTGFSDTPSRTTLPLAQTNRESARSFLLAFFVTGSASRNHPSKLFHHHYLHRLPGAALEFVRDIVGLLELAGGLAAARLA